MEYVLGAIAGVAFGALMSALKYALVWKAFLKPDKDGNVKDSKIYSVMIFSNAINVAALLIVFLLRDIMPFNFAATIVATALSLSITNRFMNVNKVVEKLQQNK